ncbi:MAG: SulP family inorganic anion transporter [Anaerolineae bacterium]
MSKYLPQRENLVGDFTAALTTGVTNIPDAMASAILAGVNPIQGLYGVMVGTPIGAIFGSSAFMTIATTSAISITAGSALSSYSPDARDSALATLALLTGIVMAVAGLLKFGRLLRFVANSVLIGFLTGVSIIIVLSQLGDFTGYSSAYSNKVVQAVDLALHLNQVNPQTTAIGLLTVLVIILTDRTRLRNFSMLIGMLVGTAVPLYLGWTGVQTVGDIAVIPSSLPMPALPNLSVAPELLLDAVAIAIIGLIQGAGVSKGYPNPDGEYPDTSRDFIGQGAANIGSGLFRGMPVGGSVSTTALNVSAGARSRWANIFSGIVVLAAVVLFGKAVSVVAVPSMAALLIVAGFQSLKREAILDIWDTGLAPRLVMLVTLVMTLIVPLQWAVLVGVVLSMLVFVLTSSREVRVSELVSEPDGTVRERPAPATLPSHAVTVLQISGSVFFAGAEQVEGLLPSPKGAARPVVIIRLRSQESIGSTFIRVLERYSAKVKEAQGRLMLAGVSPTVKGQLDRTETTEEALGAENVFMATDTLGRSTKEALVAAQRWLDGKD